MMKMTFAAVAFGVMLTGSAALALTPDQVISDLQSQGFTRVEVRVGATQMKVEAIRGSEKVEIIYDSASGTVLKTETDVVEADDNTAPGVSVRERNGDFVRVERRSRSSDDDGDDSSDDDNNDDNGGRNRGGSSDDDRNDDNGGRNRGGSSDDDRNDDNGGRNGNDSSDDDRNDDNGGRDSDDSSDDDNDDDNGGNDSGSDD